jgi:hypothetical protein
MHPPQHLVGLPVLPHDLHLVVDGLIEGGLAGVAVGPNPGLVHVDDLVHVRGEALPGDIGSMPGP